MFRQLVNDPSLQKELKLNPQEAIKIFYEIPSRNTCHRFWFGLTRLFNGIAAQTEIYNLCDTINENIILGMIPESTECKKIIDRTKAKNLKPLGLIVSSVDYFELGGNTLFLNPIATPLDWKKEGLEQFILPILDKTADVPVECLILAMDKMRECVESNKSVFIHCKAGKSRSATVLALYLAVFDTDCADNDPERALKKAVKKIESNRKQIGLDKEKISKALETIKAIQHIQTKSKTLENKEASKDDNILNALNKLHASPLIKFEISQIDSFKELAIYAAYHSPMIAGVTQRTEHIKALFNRIYTSTDANWLINYKELTEPLENADPWIVWDSGPNNSFGIGCVEADEDKRKKMVTHFYNEVIAYFATKLNCEKTSLIKSLKKIKPSDFNGSFFPKISNSVLAKTTDKQFTHEKLEHSP